MSNIQGNSGKGVQTWEWIRKKSEEIHRQKHNERESDPTTRYIFEKKHSRPEEGWIPIQVSNPTSAQPPSLLPPMAHQLIYRQGDSNQDAIPWPAAVRVHFTHNAGTILKKKNTGSQTMGETAWNCFFQMLPYAWCPLTYWTMWETLHCLKLTLFKKPLLRSFKQFHLNLLAEVIGTERAQRKTDLGSVKIRAKWVRKLKTTDGWQRKLTIPAASIAFPVEKKNRKARRCPVQQQTALTLRPLCGRIKIIQTTSPLLVSSPGEKKTLYSAQCALTMTWHLMEQTGPGAMSWGGRWWWGGIGYLHQSHMGRRQQNFHILHFLQWYFNAACHRISKMSARSTYHWE